MYRFLYNDLYFNDRLELIRVSTSLYHNISMAFTVLKPGKAEI